MLNAIEYLETAAAKAPDKLAFADEKRGFTFSQLWDAAQRIGAAAAGRAGSCNLPVPVLAERGADTLAAFMGVLASGNYYVPLDSRMPEKRLKMILKKLNAPFLICQAENEAMKPELASICPVVLFDDMMKETADEALLRKRRERVLDIDPVYLIFTSGSTGEPKGIVISHRSVIDFVDWMAEACRISQDDVMANQAPFSFDLSVKDIYLTMKCMGTCYILPKKYFLFPRLLIDELQKKKVTSLIWATSAFNIVANSGVLDGARLPSLNKVIVGGEALRAKQLNVWRRALPDVRYTNLYGPTEVTVDCAYYHIDREFADDEVIPIGYPCRNKEIVLLDDELKPVAEGEPGEICVRGAGLAKGYYGDPERTAEAFVWDPNHPEYPERLYRTGDLAYMNDEGLLIYLSRSDGQIKHMGYRVELGEVESALSGLAGVKAAVAFFDEIRDQIVCVYEGDTPQERVVKEMRKSLPKYMIPNVFRRMESMPVNLNGKVDRQLLRKGYLNEKDN